MARETSLEERTRQDAEKAAENLKRQVRLGDVPNPAKGEAEVATNSDDEGTEEESRPRARSRRK